MQHQDLCFPEFADSPDYEDFWSRLLAGNSFQDQVVRRGKNGAKVYLEANYFPLRDINGRLNGICKVCFDKTEKITAINQELADIVNVSDALESMYHRRKVQMNDTKKTMDVMQQSSADNLEITSQLKQNTAKIDQITKAVHEISYHTNILAVNTALQAVRSSENSGGFSVVAKEMRKLAKDVDQSSENIRETLQKISSEIDLIDETSGKTRAEVKQTRDGFRKNQESLAQLMQSSAAIKRDVSRLDGLLSVLHDSGK